MANKFLVGILVSLIVSLAYTGLRLDNTKAQLRTAEIHIERYHEINDKQLAAIDRLTEQNRINTEALSTLANDVGSIRAEASALNISVQRLKVDDKETRDFLTIPVPADLGRMLDAGTNGRNETDLSDPAARSDRELRDPDLRSE